MTSNLGGRSIAIWADLKSGPTISAIPQSATKLEVHFNYWHVKSQKAVKGKAVDFFDIGIMAYSCEKLSRIQIYLPTNLEAASITDLGSLFSDAITASGIFNESLAVTTTQNSNHVILQNGNALFARVYIFEKNEIRVSPAGSGTIVEIPQTAITNGCTGNTTNTPLYFRLRVLIKTENGGPFSRTIRPADSWLLSSFDYTEFLDFRLNEARNLPILISQKVRQSNPPPITRVDYLVVVGEAADVAGGVDANKKRLLENELWQKYTASASAAPLPDGMIIHHWKKLSNDESVSIGDFSAFIKLKIRRTGRSLVWRYLAVVALIGCLGSLMASVIWTKFELESKLKPTPNSTQPKANINSAPNKNE